MPVITGEIVDERPMVGMVLQRHRRQLHPDGPSFGAIDQRADIVRLHGDAEDIVEQVVDFRGVEAQVVITNLLQLRLRTQTRQA